MKTLLPMLLLLLVCSPSAHGQTTLESLRKHYGVGFDLLQKKQYKSALESFRKALVQALKLTGPKAPKFRNTLLFFMGKCHYKLGQKELAQRRLSAVEQGLLRKLWHPELAQMLAVLKARPKARPVVRRIVARPRPNARRPRPVSRRPRATPPRRLASTPNKAGATPPKPRRSIVLPVVLIASGVALLAAGGGMLALTQANLKQGDDIFKQHPNGGASAVEVTGPNNRARAFNVLGILCFGLGGAAAITGAVLLLIPGK